MLGNLYLLNIVGCKRFVFCVLYCVEPPSSLVFMMEDDGSHLRIGHGHLVSEE